MTICINLSSWLNGVSQFFWGDVDFVFKRFANSWIRRLVFFVEFRILPSLRRWDQKLPSSCKWGEITPITCLKKWGLCNVMLVFTGELTELKVVMVPVTQNPQTIIMKNRLPHQQTGSLRPCKDERPGALLWDVIFIEAGVIKNVIATTFIR